MPEINLKHYIKYLKALEKFANALNIKVKFKIIDSDGVYVPSSNTIYIDSEQSESGEIASLLHELGHVIDDIVMPDDVEEKKNKAYTVIYGKKYTKAQKRLVLRCEKAAWKNGRYLAKKLKIKLGSWYDEAEEHCIKSYKTD